MLDMMACGRAMLLGWERRGPAVVRRRMHDIFTA